MLARPSRYACKEVSPLYFVGTSTEDMVGVGLSLRMHRFMFGDSRQGRIGFSYSVFCKHACV